jgi:hypothetical protein
MFCDLLKHKSSILYPKGDYRLKGTELVALARNPATWCSFSGNREDDRGECWRVREIVFGIV